MNLGILERLKGYLTPWKRCDIIDKTNEKGIVCKMDTIKEIDDTIKKRTSEAQKKASKKYNDREMTRFSLALRNDVNDRVTKAVQKSGVNRNKWITTAILEKLEKEGFLQE